MRREYLSPSDNGAQGRGTGLSKSTVFGDDDDTRAGLDFLDALCVELTSHFGLKAPNPYLSIAINLVRGHLDARPANSDLPHRRGGGPLRNSDKAVAQYGLPGAA